MPTKAQYIDIYNSVDCHCLYSWVCVCVYIYIYIYIESSSHAANMGSLDSLLPDVPLIHSSSVHTELMNIVRVCVGGGLSILYIYIYVYMRVRGKIYWVMTYLLSMTFNKWDPNTVTPMEEVYRLQGGLCWWKGHIPWEYLG